MVVEHAVSAKKARTKSLGRRFAVIIGNDKYDGRARLYNAENDARAIADVLNSIGFDIDVSLSETEKELRDRLRKIEISLKKNPAQTGMLYYSGHGIQVQDENLIVPVDIRGEGEATDKLIRVKEILDIFVDHCETKLVFLDACRDNPFSNTVAESNERTRAFVNVKQAEFDVSGLAEINAPSDTLIAFAAAPGETATDGIIGGNSPFTKAVVDNIASVDLPLSNLLHRVSEDVLVSTNENQQPWYHSSMTRPFFFNPGSLISLTGNVLAIASVLFALMIFATTLIDGVKVGQIVGGALIVIVAIAILIFGMHRAYDRIRGGREENVETTGEFLSRIALKGGLGGIIGGICIVPIVAFPYFELYWGQVAPSRLMKLQKAIEWCSKREFCGGISVGGMDPIGKIALEMTAAGVITLSLLGVLCWVATALYWSQGRLLAVSLPSTKHLFVGSVAAGIITGVVIGPIATVYFAYYDRPIAHPFFLAPYAIVGAGFLAFSLVNYNLENMSLKQLKRSIKGTACGLVGGGIVGGVIFGSMELSGITPKLIYWMGEIQERNNNEVHIETTIAYLEGGLIYGVCLGTVLGSVFAFTRYFTPGETAQGKEVRTMVIWERSTERSSVNR